MPYDSLFGFYLIGQLNMEVRNDPFGLFLFEYSFPKLTSCNSRDGQRKTFSIFVRKKNFRFVLVRKKVYAGFFAKVIFRNFAENNVSQQFLRKSSLRKCFLRNELIMFFSKNQGNWAIFNKNKVMIKIYS